ncbi:MAG: DUF2752 domain-containing protein [Cyanobacteria bacterium P01_H01_bin.15]
MVEGLSKGDRKVRIVSLGAAYVVLGTLFFKVLGVPIQLPGCPSLDLLGIPCPGWGLTRSWMSLLSLRLVESLHYHVFGPGLFVCGVAAVVHWHQELLTNKRIPHKFFCLLKSSKTQLFFVSLLFGYHVVRLIDFVRLGNVSPY